jgi:hypothetical protein
MNRDTGLESFAVGCLFTFVLMFMLLKYVPASITYQYYAAIDECEQNLARDNHCVITAIPVVEDK